MANLPVVDVSDAPGGASAVCPHCERRLDGVLRQQLNQGFGKAYVWICPSCHKVLGVSHRKGFWMG